MIDWIDSQKLEEIVDELKQSAKRAIDNAESRRRKNVIDPFASLIIAIKLAPVSNNWGS